MLPASIKSSELDEGKSQAEQLLSKGIISCSKNNFLLAEQEFTAALASADITKSLRAKTLFNRGEARTFLNNFAGAEQDYTAMLALEYPLAVVNSQALASRASARRFQNKFAEAEQDYTAGLALTELTELTESLKAKLLFGRAEARRAQHNFTGAEQDYKAVLALGDDVPFLLRRKVFWYYQNLPTLQLRPHTTRSAPSSVIAPTPETKLDDSPHNVAEPTSQPPSEPTATGQPPRKRPRPKG